MAGKAIGSATSVDLRPGAEALIQLPDATGDASELSAKFSKDETAIKNTQVAQNKSRAPEEWTGAAADAASDEIQKLGTKTEQLAEPFRGASGALNEWATNLGSLRDQIKTLQGDWDSAIAKYHKDVAAAGPDPAGQTFISAPGAPVPSNQEAIAEYNRAIKSARRTLHSAQEGFKTTYTGLLAKCSEDAQSVANKINAARREVVSDQAGSRGRGAIGVELFSSDSPILNAAAQWAHAQEIAPEIADALKKEPKTIQDVLDFNNKYGEYIQNPFYATAISQYVTADDIYKASIDAKAASMQGATDSATNTAASFLFNKNLGSLLVMSTGGANYSDTTLSAQQAFAAVSKGLVGKDGASVEEIIQANLNEIRNAGTTDYDLTVLGAESNQFRLQGYDIFGQLTGYAARENPSLTLGADFYKDPNGGTSVFNDMIKWDHETHGAARAYSNSGQRDAFGLIPVDGTEADSAHFDPLQSVYELSDVPDNLEGEHTISDASKAVEAERMRSMQDALLEKTPFSVDGDWNGDGTKSKEQIPIMRYLTGIRAEGYPPFPDGGEAFGLMAEDVTRPMDEVPNPDAAAYDGGESNPDYIAAQKAREAWEASSKTQAALVGNFVAGYQDGLDMHAGSFGGENEYGHQAAKLRPHAGTILANWVESFTDDPVVKSDSTSGDTASIATGPAGELSPMTGRARFFLNQQIHDKLFGKNGVFTDLAFDQPKQLEGQETPDYYGDDKYEGGRFPALNTIHAAAYAEFQNALHSTMGEDYHRDVTDTTPGPTWENNVSEVTKKWGTFMWNTDQAAVTAGSQIHDQIAARNAVIRKGIDAAMSAIPTGKIAGFTGAAVVRSLASSAMNQGANSVLDQFLPTDYSSSDLSSSLSASNKTEAEVTTSLVDAFVDQPVWANSADKSKDELITQFLKSERTQPVEPLQTTTLPPYAEMTPQQQIRFVDFLKTNTYMQDPLESAHEATWEQFLETWGKKKK